MDYENDIPSGNYESDLSHEMYFSGQLDDEHENYYDYEAEYLEESSSYDTVYRPSRWTLQQLVFILIAVVILAALLVFVIVPWIQITIAPVPLYMPPPSTPLSQL